MDKTWVQIDGWFDFHWLYERVAESATAESVLVEVGVWKGKSLAFLAQKLKEMGKRPKLLGAVDTWAGSPGEEYMLRDVERAGGPAGFFQRFRQTMEECGVLELITPYVMPSTAASEKFADGSIDFCFIDGAHDYPSVLADIRAWLPKMKPDGLMAGHDATYATVQKALVETFGDDGFMVNRSCWLRN